MSACNSWFGGDTWWCCLPPFHTWYWYSEHLPVCKGCSSKQSDHLANLSLEVNAFQIPTAHHSMTTKKHTNKLLYFEWSHQNCHDISKLTGGEKHIIKEQKANQTANEAANQSFPTTSTNLTVGHHRISQHPTFSLLSSCRSLNIKIISIAISQRFVFDPFHKMSAWTCLWFTSFEMMKCWKTCDKLLQYFQGSLSSSIPLHFPQPCSRHQQSHRGHGSRSRAQRPLSGQQKWLRPVVSKVGSSKKPMEIISIKSPTKDIANEKCMNPSWNHLVEWCWIFSQLADDR